MEGRKMQSKGRIKCKIICHSNSRHLSQLYTGFYLLHRADCIDLSQEIHQLNFKDEKKPQHLQDVKHAHLQAIINDTIKVYYDAHDSCEVDENILYEVDFYFKRSYLPESISGRHKAKIHPLGLFYEIYPDHLDRFALKRAIGLDRGVRLLGEALRALKLNSFFTPRLQAMHSLPNFLQSPGILFMTKAWDPYDHPDRLPQKIEERKRLNQTRASCIKLLRREFGDLFYGGLAHTDYAKKHFKDLLLPANRFSLKRNYINLLKSYPICLATTGLHGSTGAKFAEYVAFSKAIVSEKLTYQVVGNLEPGKNYLEFDSTEECVNLVSQLVDNEELRNFIMINNYRYYLSYLRPDSLVLNTLLTALIKF